jgi:hypothetical protein
VLHARLSLAQAVEARGNEGLESVALDPSQPRIVDAGRS